MTDRRHIDPRNRLSEGVNRKRLVQEGKRAVAPTAVWLLGGVVTLVALGFLIINISNVFGRSTYDVRFTASTAFGVFEGFDDVRFRGVPAGTISKIERDGDKIVLVARIREKYGPIYKDASAQLRPITPLNDVYLDITDPGTPSAGKADPKVALPQDQLETSVSVPDVLDGLTLDARVGAYRLLDNLGNGLDDGGVKLRQAFVALAPLVTQAGQLADQVAHREQVTRRLVHNTSVLLDELGSRDTQLKRLVTSGAATLGTLQEGSADLDATLREIGPTFATLRSSLASVRGVVDDVDDGVQSLYPVADRLPQGMESVRRLSAALEPALASLQRPAREFPRWLKAVEVLSNPASRIGTSLLNGQIPPYARLTQNLIDCEPDVRGFWNWNTSLTKFGDALGPAPRGNLAFGLPAASTETVRQPPPNCVQGPPTIGGRPVQPEDLH
jgi:virulence factor Mce-like protein